MPINLVILHIAGSCGDMLSVPWINSGQYYSAAKSHDLNTSGRMMPVWSEEFLAEFPRQSPKHYHSRDWTNDLKKLSTLSRPFFINTSDSIQAQQIKNYFKNDVHTISINYQENSWPFVAKNFCSKVIDSENYLTRDDIGENFLKVVAKTHEEREYFIKLSKMGKLGYWYAKNLVDGYITYPPKSFECPADTVINVEELLNQDQLFAKLYNLANILNVKLDMNNFTSVYQTWLSTQNQPSDLDLLFG